MNVRERLQESLKQCRRDHGAVDDRAAEAGHRYVERRLAQLDVQFSRHGFGWHMPTGWRRGLVIVPSIRGWHQIDHALPPLRDRCRSMRLHRLDEVCRDLDHWAKHIRDESGRPIRDALSPRLKAWGVVLDLLPAQPQPLAGRPPSPIIVAGRDGRARG